MSSAVPVFETIWIYSVLVPGSVQGGSEFFHSKFGCMPSQ